jgi:hypothetical protein
MTHPTGATDAERGQVVVIFALLIPVLLALGAFVIGIGNWHVHGKHLQTKADAGAFAGATEWAFPCGPQIDARIDATARLYAGSNNPQVGGVSDADIHTVLNAASWYDDDSNPAPAELVDPPNPSICSAMILDVKVTEDNSFPLASLIPLFPDIKRRARVEIQEAEGITGLIPIAVRAPEPVSAAVYYNEQNGNILAVKYFVKPSGILFGLPASLQGWTTSNSEDSGTWASFAPPVGTGVAIAMSFRGACNTNLPNPNTKIVTSGAPCFEDQGFTTVNELCNQGGATQIVYCYYATGSYPSQAVQAGLHFIRGYGSGTVGDAPPQVRRVWLEPGSCSPNAYFDPRRTTDCDAMLRVEVDLGSVSENPPGPPNANEETRRAGNVEVKWGIKRQDGSTDCATFGNSCDLNSGGNPNAQGLVTYSGSVPFDADTRGNAIAIQIRVKGSTVNPNPGNCGPNLGNYSDNCRWFHVGSGISSTSVNPITNNNGTAVLGSPIQRGFRANTVTGGPVRWLRLTQDTDCDGTPNLIDLDAAAARTGGNRCFVVDMGLKGGIALDADEPPIIFDDGSGTSQTGTVDCDPRYSGQGQDLIQGVINGCGPWYARHPFDWSPACPPANNIFQTPDPGFPWNDGRWPPLRCIKTRTTGNPNQLERALDTRFFGSNNAPCPADSTGFVKGRNYWDQDNNPMNNRLYGYKDDSPLRDTYFNSGDPRVVTIFLTTPDGFTGPGQNTYPITGFVQVYITGYGSINGGGTLTVNDPCPGSTPPPQADYDCQGSACGYVVWGHFLNYVIPGPGATPSGRICNPGSSTQPCVAVLVE